MSNQLPHLELSDLHIPVSDILTLSDSQQAIDNAFCTHNGPVARMIKEQQRIEKAMKNYNRSCIRNRQEANFIDDPIEALAPRLYDYNSATLHEELSRYFPINYFDKRSSTLYLTAVPETNGLHYKNFPDIEKELLHHNCQAGDTLISVVCDTIYPVPLPVYKIGFIDKQLGGSVVKTIIDIHPWSVVYKDWMHVSVQVLHDELESTSYTGTPNMLSISRLSDRLETRMVSAGWDRETYTAESTYLESQIKEDLNIALFHCKYLNKLNHDANKIIDILTTGNNPRHNSGLWDVSINLNNSHNRLWAVGDKDGVLGINCTGLNGEKVIGTYLPSIKNPGRTFAVYPGYNIVLDPRIMRKIILELNRMFGKKDEKLSWLK